MSRIERVLRELDDLWTFYIRLKQRKGPTGQERERRETAPSKRTP